jgi:hypothetical protein
LQKGKYTPSAQKIIHTKKKGVGGKAQLVAKIEKKMLIPTTAVLDKELANVVWKTRRTNFNIFLQFGMRLYIHWMYGVAFFYALLYSWGRAVVQ